MPAGKEHMPYPCALGRFPSQPQAGPEALVENKPKLRSSAHAYDLASVAGEALHFQHNRCCEHVCTGTTGAALRHSRF